MLSTPAQALDRYDGQAYHPRSGQLLYRESHWRYREAGAWARVVVYRCPGGQAFARKQLRYGGVPTAPDFDFVDARDGYREGVRTLGARREVYWQSNSQAPEQRRPLPPGSAAVIDAGFDELVRARWTALVANQEVAASFLLPSRPGLLAMALRQQPGAAPAPRGETLLVMKMDAWYGFIAPKLHLTYRTRDRWLLRFEGIGTIRDAQGRYQEVRMEFPPDQGLTSANGKALRAVLAEPLVARCDP